MLVVKRQVLHEEWHFGIVHIGKKLNFVYIFPTDFAHLYKKMEVDAFTILK